MFAEVNTIVGSSKFGQPNLETLDVETLFIEPGSPWRLLDTRPPCPRGRGEVSIGVGGPQGGNYASMSKSSLR